MNCFLYIHRRWDRDKAVLEKALDYFRDIGHSCQVCIANFSLAFNCHPVIICISTELLNIFHFCRYSEAFT